MDDFPKKRPPFIDYFFPWFPIENHHSPMIFLWSFSQLFNLHGVRRLPSCSEPTITFPPDSWGEAYCIPIPSIDFLWFRSYIDQLIPSSIKHPNCMVPMECGNFLLSKGVFNIWGKGLYHIISARSSNRSSEINKCQLFGGNSALLMVLDCSHLPFLMVETAY